MLIPAACPALQAPEGFASSQLPCRVLGRHAVPCVCPAPCPGQPWVLLEQGKAGRDRGMASPAGVCSLCLASEGANFILGLLLCSSSQRLRGISDQSRNHSCHCTLSGLGLRIDQVSEIVSPLCAPQITAPSKLVGFGVGEKCGLRELLAGECSILKRKGCERKFSEFDHRGFDQPELDLTGAGNSSRLGLSFWLCLYNEEHKTYKNVQMLALAVAPGQCPALVPSLLCPVSPSSWHIRDTTQTQSLQTSPEYFQIICVY